ncbi:hypothetical protein H5410_017590 [Solanum commersonii]|uniref:Uncharacterized protein n=1 Tax=Solanum commersonii TaxID=4109 RepID=A0A9J5ZZI4_SOLCO|nr:hypothetical protein H5410_017590 [Solanum commersonii]
MVEPNTPTTNHYKWSCPYTSWREICTIDLSLSTAAISVKILYYDFNPDDLCGDHFSSNQRSL